MKVYLTRHGETVWNEKDLVQGMTDVPLNEVGVMQAKGLAEEMREVHLDVVYTSQLKRAADTGKMVAERHGDCRLEVCECLNEMNFGIYEGVCRSDPEYQRDANILSAIAVGSRTSMWQQESIHSLSG